MKIFQGIAMFILIVFYFFFGGGGGYDASVTAVAYQVMLKCLEAI